MNSVENNHSATETIINELANLNPPRKEFNNKQVLKALELLSNPQKSYRVIHIAGTNGKGSTAAFIEEGLYQAGFKVGKYTSPYIHSICECICLDKQQIDSTTLAKEYLKIKDFLETKQIFLSSFEMLTVIMFYFFQEQNIDFLILETGLGGKDDATNVVESEYAVITNISLEHTQWLGNTLESIATHKAGIIKPSSKTIIGDNSQSLISAVSKHTTDYISIKDKYQFQTLLSPNDATTKLTFSHMDSSVISKTTITLGLYGHFQANNFLCAYEVLSSLSINQKIIFAAAQIVKWPGRLQYLSKRPLVIADASHNPNGVETLYNSLKGIASPAETILICSILKDKDQIAMLDNYSKLTQNVIFCGIPDQPRASSPISLAKLSKGKFRNIYLVQSPRAAYRLAQRINKHLLVISGSTYLLRYFIKA